MHPLVFSQVSKSIGSNSLVSRVSMCVRDGETVLLCGLNGAGKTSLIRLALDFMQVDSGRIRIFGQPAHAAVARQRLAFLPERFSAPADLTGEQVLNFLCGLRQQPYRAADSARWLERLDFPLASLKKPVRRYSKGMLQKLGLSSVLMANTELTILDEPLSGLDPVARKSVLQCLREIRDTGRSLLFTSHTLTGTEPLIDSIAAMHQGCLRFQGSPDAMKTEFDQPDLEQAFIACVSDRVDSARTYQ